MTTLSVSEARAGLKAMLDRVKDGDEVVITQSGEPVAVVVHPTRLQARRSTHAWDAAAMRLDRLREARSRRPGRGVGLRSERADELAAEVRRERDEQ